MTIQLVKPEFIAGDEKRFSSFISKLNGKDKVALVSHTDLDGITAARVTNTVIDADYLMLKEYAQVNDTLVIELRDKKVKFVIFTDINITNKEIVTSISKFAEVLIIDHHRLNEDYNNERVCYLNAQGFCAGYLCYYLFSKIQNLEAYDWLVACSCVSDWLFLKPSSWLQAIFAKYGDKLVVERDGVRKNGFFWNLQYNLSLLLIYFRENIKKAYELIDGKSVQNPEIERYAYFVKKEVDNNLAIFKDKSISIKDGYYFEPKSKFKIGEMMINELSAREPGKTFVSTTVEGEFIKSSARRQDGKVDMSIFVKSLTAGFENSSAGGHIKAAGCNFPAKYLPEFKKRLGILA